LRCKKGECGRRGHPRDEFTPTATAPQKKSEAKNGGGKTEGLKKQKKTKNQARRPIVSTSPESGKKRLGWTNEQKKKTERGELEGKISCDSPEGGPEVEESGGGH